MDLSLFLPERSIEDIFAERVRLVIGGEEYALPALSIEKNEAWLATVESEDAKILSALDDAGDDLGSLIKTLQEDPGPMLDLVESYDEGHILPGRAALRTGLTPMGLVKVVWQIWRAANPKADIAIAALATAVAVSNSKPRRTSSRRQRGAGQLASSGPN